MLAPVPTESTIAFSRFPGCSLRGENGIDHVDVSPLIFRTQSEVDVPNCSRALQVACLAGVETLLQENDPFLQLGHFVVVSVEVMFG